MTCAPLRVAPAHCVCNDEVHSCKIQITAGTRLVVSQRSISIVAKFMHLPRAQSDGIKSVDLKSPNELTEEEYNSYSGAAIGGTLLMLIPVAYYDGLLFEFAKSFAISALLGGGLGAYLSLRKDGVGEKAGEFGSAVVNKVKEI
jgi:hypothetical protein